MTEITCKKCQHNWNYQGEQTYYCTCPKCLNKVPLPKAPTTFKLSD